MSSFEKTRLAEILSSSPQEAALCEMILNIEISLAIRAMGAAKDWQDADLELFAAQVLQGFLARAKTISFASMILFFKMRRARLAPCNTLTYGMHPLAILDNFNEFVEWQRQQVAQAAPRQTLRSDAVGKTLAEMPLEFRAKFAETQLRLKQMEKEQKAASSRRAAMEMQVSRLYSCLYFKYRAEHQNTLEHIAKSEVEKQLNEFLQFHQPQTGNDLKALIEDYFPTGKAMGEPASVMFKGEDVPVVQVGDSKGSYPINGCAPLVGTLLYDFIKFGKNR